MTGLQIKDTPGGNPLDRGNPSPAERSGAVAHSYSGGATVGPSDASLLVPLLEGEIERGRDGEEEERGGDGGEVRVRIEEEGEGAGSATPVDGRWHRRKYFWYTSLLVISSLMLLVLQVYGTQLLVVSAVNQPISQIDMRLHHIEVDTHHMMDELHILCRIITSHDECREMLARMHNKTMHSANGNTGRGEGADPNPPAQAGLRSDRLKKRPDMVGPLPYKFDNEAAKAVQALISHPLQEAASNQISILMNHVKPASHNIPSVYESTHWNTFNIPNRSYVGMYYLLVPDSGDEVSVSGPAEEDIRPVKDLIRDGVDFIVRYDNPKQVGRTYGESTGKKFATGKYYVLYSGNLIMTKRASQFRSFLPSSVSAALLKIKKEDESAKTQGGPSSSRTVEHEESSYVVLDIPATPGRDPPPPPAPVQTVWPLYADILPVRVLTVSSTNYDTGARPTYTPLKISIDEINADKMGAGLSVNLIRGWNQTDINSLNLIVAKMSKSQDSFFEEAALVRIGCILNAITPDAYSIDPVTKRFVRRVVPRWRNVVPSIVLNKAKVKGFTFIVTTTDLVGLYLRNKTFPVTLVEPFKSGTLDKQWTIIPIDPSKYSGKSIIAYIAAFLDSSLWEGSVNYTTDVQARDETGNTRTARYVTMPTCNSVRIPGKKNFMLVLVNEVGMNAPNTVPIGGVAHNVWRDYRAAPTMYEFATIWNTVWNHNATEAQLNDFGTHLVRAWNVISDTLATMDCVGRALSVVSELSTNFTYGIAKTLWSEEGVAEGAWTLGGGQLDPNTPSVSTRDIFGGCVGQKNDKGRIRLTGYNFGYHSSWMTMPQSFAKSTVHRMDDKLNPDKSEIFWEKVDIMNPQYHVKESTSFFRIALTFGLIETTHLTMPMFTAMGMQNWLNAHGVLLAMATTDFVVTSSIPPTSWFLCSGAHDPLTTSTMANAHVAVTLGLAVPDRIEELMEDTEEWSWNSISYYYGFPVDDNEYDSMMPFNCSSMLQWFEKTGQNVPHPTLPVVILKTFEGGALRINRVIQCHTTDRLSLIYAGATPDMLLTNYMLQVRWACTSSTSHAYLWCEQVEPETFTNGEYASLLRDQSKLVTQTLAISDRAWPVQTDAEQASWLTRSLSDDNSDMPPQCVSKLILPDPIDWKAFLEGIRDWVIYPAAHGGLGYLAGGVPGAVVGAGASLLSKISKDAEGKTDAVVTPIATVANNINDAMLNQAQKTGQPLTAEQLAEIAREQALRGPQGGSQNDSSGQQPI